MLILKLGRGLWVDKNRQFVYRGQWEYDMKHGDGNLTTMNSSDYMFDGQFNSNLKHGHGRLVTTKAKYVGNFKE